MANQVIINARTKQASVSNVGVGLETTVFAVDLVGDTWHDFKYFAGMAYEHELNGKLDMRNRYMRSAISNLFSHIDAVVSDVYDLIQCNDPQFGTANERPSLKDRMFALRDYARVERSVKLPYVNLDLKILRDIVNHPTITKERFNKSTRETILYSGVDVYGISLDDLNTSGAQIDAWLNKVCTLFQYERFCDTARLCTDFARQLGDQSPEVRGF